MTRKELIEIYEEVKGCAAPTEKCPTCNRPVFVFARTSEKTPECFDCVRGRKEYDLLSRNEVKT